MAGERFEEAKALCDDLCDKFLAAEYGPAHVVVSDYNFDDEFVRNARRTIDLMLAHGTTGAASELRATRDVLDALLAIPEVERVCPDAEYHQEDNP